MTDCCIIGGGIIGLSIARELAGRGTRVRVVAREHDRGTASWAAAGIFPPVAAGDGMPGDALTAWSDRLHRAWSRELLDETGVDNELRSCGGLHVAGDEADRARLAAAAAAWHARGIRSAWLDAADLRSREPALAAAVARGDLVGGWFLPDELRIRPSRHLEALARSCLRRGVEITSGVEVRGIDVLEGRVVGLETTAGPVRAGTYCLAAGAWAGGLAARFGLRLETRPIRGQILLYALPRQVLGHVVNLGIDYLVPRDDGRLLVGSTIEDAGFASVTTAAGIERLRGVARRLLGDLRDAREEQAWAGLRPGSVDGLPTIGPIPGFANAFVAAGHFRAGLHQSTGTAVLLADLVTGNPPALDPTPFAADRPSAVRDPSRPPAPDSVDDYLARAAGAA